jgi:hypothetical protein
MNVFHFLVIFLNPSQSTVEKSRLPEKARSPLPALMRSVEPALIDCITRETVTGKRGNMIAAPAAAGSLKKTQAVSTERKAEVHSRKQILFILTPDF